MTSDQIYRWILESRNENSGAAPRYTVKRGLANFRAEYLKAGKLVPPDTEEIFRQEWKNVSSFIQSQYFAPLWSYTSRRRF